jgi:type IV secretion system protein VirD4
MNSKARKLIITNLPYLFIVLMATKLGLAWRLAEGADFAGRVMHLPDGIELAFQTLVPSFHPLDLFVGIAVGASIRIAVHVRGKNAKKYRKNMEYGSARWGTSEDIRPYVDPVFRNNVILTQTERLTMNNRPKDPKTARNKNVLIIGGSGSGKTRFWLKPNLMQCHSSYVVTDPKGLV